MTTDTLAPVSATLNLRRLYCSKAVFEQRLLPGVENPPRPGGDFQVEIGLAQKTDPSDPDRLSVQLVVRLEPSASQNQPYFVEVAYVGDFGLDAGLKAAELDAIARVNCAAILLPYVRQTVTDLTSRGTNGPIVLQPINVAAMLAGSAEE